MRTLKGSRSIQQLRNLIEDDRYFTDIEEEEDSNISLRRIPETGTTLYLLGTWIQALTGANNTLRLQREDIDGNVLQIIDSTRTFDQFDTYTFRFAPVKIVGGEERITLFNVGGREITSLWWGWLENTVKSS